MAEIIRMPRMSDTMEEGVIVEWHKKVGDDVSSGDLLAEVETDKATMELESYQEGKLLHIGVQTGEAVPVDAIIAVLGEDGEDIEAILKEAKEEKAGEASSEKEEKKEEPVQKEASTEKQKEPESQAKSAPEYSDARVKASPLAKKMAEDAGIDIAKLKGSGDDGRIIKRDVEAARSQGTAPQVSFAPLSADEGYADVQVSQMRKAIARRLGESKFSAPHFYLTISVDMEQIMDSRKRMNEASPVKISINDFILKAASMALRKHPQVNSSWLDGVIRTYKHVHMGVAVAIDEGLIVPVVKHADHKGLTQIAAEVKDLATKAQNKKLKPEEFEGNTFTVSNLGMFGIEEFTAIINPPDACILAVGAINEVPVLKDGELYAEQRMKMTLSCDHRVVDGATGAKFLQTLKSYLEDPVQMLA